MKAYFNLKSPIFQYLSLVLTLPVLWSCQPKVPLAYAVVNEAIERHGGMRYDSLEMSFDMGDGRFILDKKGATFMYSRQFKDSLGQPVADFMDNDGFIRLVDGVSVGLSDDFRGELSRALEGTIFFILLPHGLNNRNARKEYIGHQNLKGEMYHVIKVGFSEGNSTEPYNATFLFWINMADQYVDYIAYELLDLDKLRFREAYNRREVNGLIIQDYYNYKPTDKEVTLHTLKDRYEKGKLELHSEINHKNISVAHRVD